MERQISPIRLGDAQPCPVCKGEGQHSGQRCHGCDGKGWVVVWHDLAPTVKPPLKPNDTNPYSVLDGDGSQFGKGPPPPVFFPGCAPGCHTGKHTHHSTVPWMYGDPYEHKCSRCGYPACDLAYGGKGEIYLCDCCWEDWHEAYDRNVNMQTFIKPAEIPQKG